MYLISDIPDAECVISFNNGYTIIGEGIEVVAAPEKAVRGENVQLRFRGAANETYYIRVYYSSGLSQSKAFEPVCSDDSGMFGWSWKVPSNARAGDIRIIVTSEDARVDLKMKIV